MNVTSTARQNENRTSLIRCKVILCGPAGVGKTSFFGRCLGRKLDPVAPAQPTVGVDMHVLHYTHQGQKFELALWDTAGQEAFMSLTASFYRGADACLVFVDLSDTTTERWRARQKELQRWLDSTRAKVEKECLLLCVGTKRDQCTHQVMGGEYEQGVGPSQNTFPQFTMSQPPEDEGDDGSTAEVLFHSTESLFVTSSRYDPASCFAALLQSCCRCKLSMDEVQSANSPGAPVLPPTTKDANSKLQRDDRESRGSFFSASC